MQENILGYTGNKESQVLAKGTFDVPAQIAR